MERPVTLSVKDQNSSMFDSESFQVPSLDWFLFRIWDLREINVQVVVPPDFSIYIYLSIKLCQLVVET